MSLDHRKKKENEGARVPKVIQKSTPLNSLHLFLPTGLAADHLAAFRLQGQSCGFAGFTGYHKYLTAQLTRHSV